MKKGPLPPSPVGEPRRGYIFYRFIRFIRNALSLSEAPLEASKTRSGFLSEKGLFYQKSLFSVRGATRGLKNTLRVFLSERRSGAPLSEKCTGIFFARADRAPTYIDMA